MILRKAGCRCLRGVWLTMAMFASLAAWAQTPKAKPVAVAKTAAQPTRPRLVVVIVGGPSGSEVGAPGRLEGLAASLGIADCVRMEAPCPQRELADWYRAADMVLVPPGSIPITTSGKIRRSQCVELYRQDKFTRLDA